MTEKIGSLIIDLQDKTISAEEREILNHPLVGGVILFARNYESREQLNKLCADIRSSRQKKILIMVDQEGGRVQRFLHDFTRLPFMAVLGKVYDENIETACRLANDCGWLMAVELLSEGIDLSLAPVLDLNKGVSSIIGQRAFHSQPQPVIQLATAFIQGMSEAGMAAIGKHFPGHGSVSLDSHVTIPKDERLKHEIENEDMASFAGMIKAGIPAIMAAHIIFPHVDKMPVGFSQRWLKDILRDELQFTGVIFSDDLSMEGANISSNYTDRVVVSREAGCDFTLLCNNRPGVIQVLDHLPAPLHMISKEKWGKLQGDFSHSRQSYKEHKRWHETCASLNKLTNDF
ncbi:MAG: beta-N-acetylhexosaminidase [Gammaproteobacteria bacterium]|nr:beta-N-acetylhexosaminidase [Gammaproteobacteria bacterium]MCW5583205.1 beta-N-acetylhexosaminidase [Gammaproteobacteria bacterium]